MEALPEPNNIIIRRSVHKQGTREPDTVEHSITNCKSSQAVHSLLDLLSFISELPSENALMTNYLC